uniref:ADP-sugar pyrophosphatase n=1 Tax=Magallana gigas TaxID=29159 RepID=K1PT40_MAGGI
MASPNAAKFVKEEEVARGKWLSLNNITYTDPTGRERQWECVKRTTRQTDSADAVGIIAILKRMLKFDCIVLVLQYRPPMKCCSVEIPAGLVDAGESPETAAVRELYEETGYTASVKHVTPEFIEVVLIPVDDLLQRLDDYAKSGCSVDSRVYSYALGLQPKTS